MLRPGYTGAFKRDRKRAEKRGKPRLTGAIGEHCNRFVRASVGAVRLAKFYPAEVAGCKVKQLVRLPLSYNLRC